jgi:hypothetical protein
VRHTNRTMFVFAALGGSCGGPGRGKAASYQVGFDEGNAEQYVWYVPQNIAGLVTALGRREAVVDPYSAWEVDSRRL